MYRTPKVGLIMRPPRLLLNDVDGVFVKPGYDTYGDLQRGPDEDTDRQFEFYRKHGSDHPYL